ncbi:MAG: hypothetical protein ACOYUZ_03550 [Patescibacteria group bacterium]
MLARTILQTVLALVLRNTFFSVIAAVFVMTLFPGMAWAADPKSDTPDEPCVLQIENKVIDGKRYKELTLSGRRGCDLWYAASQFPQKDPETGKVLPRLAQLRSIYAANGTRMQEGAKKFASVHRGCVTGYKPWSEQTEEENEYCGGRVNYYPVAMNGGYPKVLVPVVPEKTITEQYSDLSSESCHALAKIENPSDEVRAVLANCKQHFADIVIPIKVEPQETLDQKLLREARGRIANLEAAAMEKDKVIAAITPSVQTKKQLGWGLLVSLLANGLGLVWVHRERKGRKHFQGLSYLSRTEMDERVAAAVRKEVAKRIAQAREFLRGHEDASEAEVAAFALDQIRADLEEAQKAETSCREKLQSNEKTIQTLEKGIADMKGRLADRDALAVKLAKAETDKQSSQNELAESVANVERLINALNALQAQYDELEAKQTDNAAYANRAFTARDRALDALQEKREELAQANAELDKLRQDKQANQKKIAELENRIALLEHQKSEAEQKLERMAQAAFNIQSQTRQRTQPYSSVMRAEQSGHESSEKPTPDARKQTLPYFTAKATDQESDVQSAVNQTATESPLLGALQAYLDLLIANQNRQVRMIEASVRRLKDHHDAASSQLMIDDATEDDAEVLRARRDHTAELLKFVQDEQGTKARVRQAQFAKLAQLPWSDETALKLVAILTEEQNELPEAHALQLSIQTELDGLNLVATSSEGEAWTLLTQELLQTFDLDEKRLARLEPKQKVEYILQPLRHVMHAYRTSSGEMSDLRAELAVAIETGRNSQKRSESAMARLAQAQQELQNLREQASRQKQVCDFNRATQEDVQSLTSTELWRLTSLAVGVIAERARKNEPLELAVASMEEVYPWNAFLRLAVVGSMEYQIPQALQDLARRMGSLRIAHLAHNSCQYPQTGVSHIRQNTMTMRPPMLAPACPSPDARIEDLDDGQGDKID